MPTFTKLPEFPFFVVHREELWCVYTVTQNMQREDKVSLRWFENGKYLVADYYTKINVLGYLNSGMWLLCDKDGNIIENYTEEKKCDDSTKEIKTIRCKGYVRRKHQPYTDYNKEIEDWLKNNSDDTEFNAWDDGKFIFTGDSTFYRESIVYDDEVYYTNEEFKKLIGMDTTPEKSDTEVSAKQRIEQLLSTRGEEVVEWLTYKLKEFDKLENIRKELEFAEAKKARLEKHIDVLKSKLQ